VNPALNMPVLVSILVPAYNAAPWINAALDSALAQTWPRVEVIVVDDGSRDDTLVRARAFAAQYPGRELHIATQPNAGAAAARNHALRLARGDFIQYLDADDLLAPEKIALQLDALRTAPTLALASGRWGRFQSKPKATIWNEEAVARARTGVEFLQLHYETGSMMQPGAWLAPRSLLDRSGPWDESLSLNDDGEYFARVMLRSSAIVPVPAARCHYRTGTAPRLSRRRDPRALISLHRSTELTTAHLLTADDSVRSRAAAARAWRRLAFELYPCATSLARSARASAVALGAPSTPLGGPDWVANAAALLGWSVARRLHLLRDRLL
jgi:glycosyltransferase involved in cell wall biosynthesis